MAAIEYASSRRQTPGLKYFISVSTMDFSDILDDKIITV